MKDEHKKIEWITGDLYLYTDFSRGQLYKAINLGTFDWAVPQDWFESHMDEVKARGGAVWYYSEKDYFGQPYFDDNALCALKTLIRQVLEENKNRTKWNQEVGIEAKQPRGVGSGISPHSRRSARNSVRCRDHAELDGLNRSNSTAHMAGGGEIIREEIRPSSGA